MRRLTWPLVLALATAIPLHALAQGDPDEGEKIARLWCASCHVVAPDQAVASAEVPSFMSIAARSGDGLGWLQAFLAEPHPPMPDLSLTRAEIRDLIAYFDALRR